MFLVFGLVTVLWGILIFFLLPDSPMNSRYPHNEKVLAIERLRDNMTGIENKTFKFEQLKETVLDPKTWLFVVAIIAGNVPTGATGSYASTLIKGFGYTSKQSALLNIPSGIVSMVRHLRLLVCRSFQHPRMGPSYSIRPWRSGWRPHGFSACQQQGW